MQLNKFESHGCGMKCNGYKFIDYSRNFEEEIISHVLDSFTKWMIHF